MLRTHTTNNRLPAEQIIQCEHVKIEQHQKKKQKKQHSKNIRIIEILIRLNLGAIYIREANQQGKSYQSYTSMQF